MMGKDSMAIGTGLLAFLFAISGVVLVLFSGHRFPPMDSLPLLAYVWLAGPLILTLLSWLRPRYRLWCASALCLWILTSFSGVVFIPAELSLIWPDLKPEFQTVFHQVFNSGGPPVLAKVLLTASVLVALGSATLVLLLLLKAF
jgi:hypothetical protein